MPVTDTVRTAGRAAGNESQRGQFPEPEFAHQGDPGVTAERGSNPRLGAALFSSQLHRKTGAEPAVKPFAAISVKTAKVAAVWNQQHRAAAEQQNRLRLFYGCFWSPQCFPGAES